MASKPASPAESVAPVDSVDVRATAPERHAIVTVGACGLALLALSGMVAPAAAQVAVPVISMSAQTPLPYARNHVEVRTSDGESRARAIELASAAGTTLSLSTRSFSGDDAARMVDTLVSRAAAGIHVTVQVEEIDPALAARLETSRVAVSHGKVRGTVLEADGHRLEGSYGWSSSDGASTSVELDPSGDANAWVRPLRNDAHHRETREALLAHIRAARASIFIEAHGLDDPEIIDALRSAADQGIAVNVILNHTAGDLAPGFNNLHAAVGFSEPNHQVPFRWYEGGPLASMTAVFDSQYVLVGQEDWTARGRRVESDGVLIQDHATAADVKFQMMTDWQEHGQFAPVRSPFARTQLR
jgi:phosphatidylserine/phosphatidylglycerophosphate/cardiolipin synthase-like enzyme